MTELERLLERCRLSLHTLAAASVLVPLIGFGSALGLPQRRQEERRGGPRSRGAARPMSPSENRRGYPGAEHDRRPRYPEEHQPTHGRRSGSRPSSEPLGRREGYPAEDRRATSRGRDFEPQEGIRGTRHTVRGAMQRTSQRSACGLMRGRRALWRACCSPLATRPKAKIRR